DILALAYPGTACPSSWTVACSTSLAGAPPSPPALASQSWCCPPSYGCETSPGSRLCQSFAQTRTAVVLADSPSSSTNFSVFMVHTPAFPLRANAGGDGEETAAGSTAAASSGNGGGLGAGAIVGLVFGLVIALAALGAGWYVWRYNKRRREGALPGAGNAEEVEMNGLDKDGRAVGRANGKGKGISGGRYRDHARFRDGVFHEEDMNGGGSVASGSGTNGYGNGNGGAGAGAGGGGRGVGTAGSDDAATRYAR
ncbi:hypothetical protein MKZ38_009319, partial [Zalerion maritima]